MKLLHKNRARHVRRSKSRTNRTPVFVQTVAPKCYRLVYIKANGQQVPLEGEYSLQKDAKLDSIMRTGEEAKVTRKAA